MSQTSVGKRFIQIINLREKLIFHNSTVPLKKFFAVRVGRGTGDGGRGTGDGGRGTGGQGTGGKGGSPKFSLSFPCYPGRLPFLLAPASLCVLDCKMFFLFLPPSAISRNLASHGSFTFSPLLSSSSSLEKYS